MASSPSASSSHRRASLDSDVDLSDSYSKAEDQSDDPSSRPFASRSQKRPRAPAGGRSSGWSCSPTSLRRVATGLLVVLGLFLLGTVIVLSTVQRYFSIADWAYLTEIEIPWEGGRDVIPTLGRLSETGEYIGRNDSTEGPWGPEGEGTGSYWMRKDWDGKVEDVDDWTRLYNVTNRPGERIPRLIHQTWKNDVLPDKWQRIWRECREGLDDYEYMLWTDDLARRFIAERYPSFLSMYDGYEYNIQRADAIRYFVLHQFGGIYMDLDIGCARRLEPLLSGDWDVLLPRTKPVGVSNDLIFSSRGNSFMEGTVHGLIAFNHKYLTNYPTVMFSTGPMFLSAQYGLYTSAHPLTSTHPRAEIRILPKSLYGKNAKAGEAPHSFFSHWYGSSWHADDADFITFLGAKGRWLMYAGIVVFVLGGLRMCYLKAGNKTSRRGLRNLLVRGFDSNRGQYQMVSMMGGGGQSDEQPTSPADSRSDSDTDGEGILEAVRLMLRNSTGGRRKGILFFLPASFFASSRGTKPRRGRTASSASELPYNRSRSSRRGPQRPSRLVVPEATPLSPVSDVSETEGDSSVRKSNFDIPQSPNPPPPYHAGGGTMDEVDEFLSQNK